MQPRGGGVRSVTVSNEAALPELIQLGKELFFIGDKKSDEYNFSIGNYKGNVIDEENFTVRSYINDHKLTKTRLYLMSKKKSKYDRLRVRLKTSMIELSDDDNDDSLLQTPVFTGSSK